MFALTIKLSIPRSFVALTVDQRLQHARNLPLCFNCLSPHQFADCQSTRTCRSDGCNKKHHTLLHKDYNSISSKAPSTAYRKKKDDSTNCTSSTRKLKSSRQIPTLPKSVSYGSEVVHAYAMLDCASTLTLLKTSVALWLIPDLKLTERIQLNQALTSSDTAAAKMTISVESYNDKNQSYELNDIDVIKDWNLPDFNPALVNSICQRNKHLRHIHNAQLPTNEVEIIIDATWPALSHQQKLYNHRLMYPVVGTRHLAGLYVEEPAQQNPTTSKQWP